MREAEISVSLYGAAREDPEITVISWQGTGGKRYVTRKVVLRLPNGRRMLPDLVFELDDCIWIIEIKGSHAEALKEDEPKLDVLRTELPPARILELVELHGGHPVRSNVTPRYAAAYSKGEAGALCVPDVAHIPWEDMLQTGERLVDRLRDWA